MQIYEKKAVKKRVDLSSTIEENDDFDLIRLVLLFFHFRRQFCFSCAAN